MVERMCYGIEDYDLKDDISLADVKHFTHFVRSVTFGGELIASITTENSKNMSRYDTTRCWHIIQIDYYSLLIHQVYLIHQKIKVLILTKM